MSLQKTRIVKPDGRRLWLYSWDKRAPREPASVGGPALEAGGLELRWNPVLEEWIVVAPERQERTFFPPDEYCPLCPTRDATRPTELPAIDYEIAVFENRFPSFSKSAARPARTRPPYAAAKASGSAEVVVYSSEHGATLSEMSQERVERLVEVWTDRYRELAARREVQYVLIFENRGEEIGVTLTHPHGQIYAFPFVPPVPARELSAAARYRRANGTCLHCDIVAAETKARQRVVAVNDGFVVFVPYYARYPYEIQIVSRRHHASLLELSESERRDLAAALQTILRKFDNLWSRPMPFVMVLHQRPSDGRRYPGCHLHVEFTPPYRDREKLKFLAGCETGAGVFINDARAEETAEELRRAEPRT
jgi:UDPglucose--hexose-1-phosphate uridylyltransferase